MQKREILQKDLKHILKNNKKSLSSFVPLAPFLPVLGLTGATTSTSASVSSLLSPAVEATCSGALSCSLPPGVALHVLVQSQGLGEEGRRPVEKVGVGLLHEEAVRPCCLVTVVVVELVQLMASHILLCDDGEVTGCKPEQAPLLLPGLPCCDVHQFHGGIVQVAACVRMQHVIARQRPMWALGVRIRDDAG